VYSVCYLHKNNITHRDIKLENFLLFREDDLTHIKMIDFGLATKLSAKEEVLTEMIGSILYVAPEVLSGQYSMYADNWSMGVVLYVLLSGTYPFDGESDEQIGM
jgi:calcium-dependent protein kinase